MRLQINFVGAVSVFLQFVGAGVALAFPEARWFGLILIAVGVIPLLLWAAGKLHNGLAQGWRPSVGAQWLIWVGLAITSLGVMMALFQYAASDKPLRGPPRNTGEINAAALSKDIQTLLDSAIGKFDRRLEIGPTGTIIAEDSDFSLSAFAPILPVMAAVDFLVERIEGRLFVSTKVRDMQGRLVGELIRNEWKVPPHPAVWDRNYTRDALEIRDDRGEVVLQVILFPDRVQLQGIWRHENGGGVALVAEPNEAGVLAGSIHIRKDNSVPFPKIAPLFRYPSETHFGERIR